MSKKYHYEYYWVNVDLCFGGIKSQRFRNYHDRRWYKPNGGLSELKKVRVYD